MPTLALTEAQWGIVLGCLTAGVLKGLDWWLAKSGRGISQRADLRTEVAALWARVHELETELDKERERRRKLEDQNATQQRLIEELQRRLAVHQLGVPGDSVS